MKDLVTPELGRSTAAKVSMVMRQKHRNEPDIAKIGTKNISTEFSQTFERIFPLDLTYFTGEFFDTSGFDHDPDVFNVGKTKTLELKCTGSNGNWLGNSTSKRPDFYTMIKWDSLTKFYMGLLWLDEDEWKPSKSKDFKGTTFSKYQLWDRSDRIDLMGNLEIKEYKLNGELMVRPLVKIITEEVDDSLVSEEWLNNFLKTEEGHCPYCDKIK